MKLAYLTSRFPFAYIGETFFVPEVRLLAKLCDEVHVIAARPESPQPLFGDLGAVNVRISPGEIRTLLEAAAEAAAHPLRCLRAFAAVAFGRCSLKARLKNLALFPKALAVSRYIRAHRIDYIHANWLTTSSTVAYVASIMTGVPWSCTAHAHDIFANNLPAQKSASARFIRFIAQRNREHFHHLVRGRTPPTPLVHLGVDIPPAHAPAASANGRLRVLCAARLDPIKGHEYLLQALALLRRLNVAVHCDLAGNGELEETLRQRAAALNVESMLTFRGVVEHHIVLQELREGRYDAVVLPSLEHPQLGKHEGIPVALIEAMAAGVPCVATSTGCIPELIDERSGILVAQRDAHALANAFMRLQNDRQFRLELGRVARARAAEEFDAAKTTRRLYDLMVLAAGQRALPVVSNPETMPAANAN